MDENIDNNTVLAILDNQSTTMATYKPSLEMPTYTTENQTHNVNQDDNDGNESNKQNTIWTKNATLMLLSLYEIKMPLLDNPKKKSKMWASIATELKSLNIVVTPDQVRWKINALTKKYKDCIDGGLGPESFSYYNEMHQILGRYNDNSETYRLASGVSQQNSSIFKSKKNMSLKRPYRKLREERRAKVELDKKWIEYLQKQEEQNSVRDQRRERNLKLKEEELQLRKTELELKHTLTLKKLLLKERKQEELIKIEKEKCALLRKLLAEK